MSENEICELVIVGDGPGGLRRKYTEEIVPAAADGWNAALAAGPLGGNEKGGRSLIAFRGKKV